MAHSVLWHTPTPLWRVALQDSGTRRFKRPELLRFAQDTFMEDLQQVLESDAEKLLDYVAQVETWQDPMAGWLPETADAGAPVFQVDQEIPLYQPAHQRFYLVGASLVCQVRGLPDKPIDTAADEAVSFVLRRRVPTAGVAFDEYGWFGEAGWKRINEPTTVDNEDAEGTVEREERLPLFAMTFGSNGKARRLLAGFVPVAGRETYEAAPREGAVTGTATELEADQLSDPRKELFQNGVVGALQNLREHINRQLIREIGNPVSDDDQELRREEAQDILAFALLDLAEFLQDHVSNVWDEITGTASLDALEQPIYDALDTDIVTSLTWVEALQDVADEDNREMLLAGPREGTAERNLTTDGFTRQNIRIAIDRLLDQTTLETDVTAFIAGTSDQAPERDEIEGAPPEVDAAAGAVYHVRCVYERPTCGRYRVKPVVSPPTQPFRLASFFDPDAPIRPVRVTLPVDTSIAGLRKFPKNVSFLVSNELRKQASRVDGIDLDALNTGDLNDSSSFNLGMICSLSIPIITICAFILLMIIVFVLNIVFWWIPFFKICFPLNLKSS